MGFGLFLMDSEICNINRLDQKKKIRLDRIDRIFKVISYFASIFLYHYGDKCTLCMVVSSYSILWIPAT